MAVKIDEYLRIAGMILGGLGAIGSIIYFCAYISIFFEEEKEPSKFSWFLSIFLTLGILLCVFYFLLCILLIKGILDVSIIGQLLKDLLLLLRYSFKQICSVISNISNHGSEVMLCVFLYKFCGYLVDLFIQNISGTLSLHWGS